MRSKYGLDVSYECMTTFDVRGDFCNEIFPNFTSFLKGIEVHRGFYAELVFTYKAEELRDKNSGWRVVAYTEFVAGTLASILFWAYDNIRAWVFITETCRVARDLNLELILRSIQDLTKALRIIEVVENTRFDTLPEHWGCRGDYDTGSVGRVGPGADYLY